ncbi:hypothetical protein BDC45DRAFT_585235, partial [Circinella umbellata]
MSEQTINPDINQVQQLVEQVTRQQQLIEDLYQARTDSVAPSPVTPVPHHLPVRPSFDWTPSATLTHLMPTLDQSTFTSTLAAEECTQLIERYPPIHGFIYKASAPVPEAARLFSKRQVHEDNTLCNFQYTLSAVLRPLDVLGYMILPLLPADQVERIFATINDIRTLILHTEGTINQARNQLALRAVNPSIRQPTSERTYTMAADVFKETVSNHMALQKSLREARFSSGNRFRPSNRHPVSSAPSSFFRSSPSGDGGHPDTTFPRTQHSNNPFRQHQSRSTTNTNTSRPRHTNQFHNSNSNSNNNSIRNNRQPTIAQTAEQKFLLQQEIADLLNKKAIEPVTSGQGFSSTMFVIPKRNGGFRPVFNLKILNQYLHAPKFKMETLQQVIKMIQPNDYLTSIDLAD